MERIVTLKRFPRPLEVLIDVNKGMRIIAIFSQNSLYGKNWKKFW